MKKILYSFLLFASSILFAQANTNVQFTVCNDVLGTVEMFGPYKKGVVSKLFYKREKLPQHLKKFSYLAEKGLTEFKLKKDFGTPDILSLGVLNEQNNLAIDTPVNIEGYIFKETSINIYSEMVKKIEVKEDNGKKILFILTTDN